MGPRAREAIVQCLMELEGCTLRDALHIHAKLEQDLYHMTSEGASVGRGSAIVFQSVRPRNDRLHALDRLAEEQLHNGDAVEGEREHGDGRLDGPSRRSVKQAA